MDARDYVSMIGEYVPNGNQRTYRLLVKVGDSKKYYEVKTNWHGVRIAIYLDDCDDDFEILFIGVNDSEVKQMTPTELVEMVSDYKPQGCEKVYRILIAASNRFYLVKVNYQGLRVAAYFDDCVDDFDIECITVMEKDDCGDMCEIEE